MPRRTKPHWNKSRQQWYANVGPPDRNGRRTEKFAPKELRLGPKDEGKAWEWMEAERAKQDAKEAPVAGDAALTIRRMCELYLEWAERRKDDRNLSKGHYENKGYHLSHFEEEFGRREAVSLTPEDMEAFVVSLKRKRLAPSYIDNICATVSAAFNWAERAKHLPTSPIRGFEPPAVPVSPERFAERIEAAIWLRHFWRRSPRQSVAGRYDRLTTLLQRLLIRTGARPGELCALLWSDIKWTGWTTETGSACARATIPPERWKTGGTTGKARTIYIPPALTRALKREMARPDRHPTHVFIKGRGFAGRGAGDPWPDSSILSRKIRDVRRELIEVQEEIRRRLRARENVTGGERRLSEVEIQDEGPNRVVNYRWRHTAISTLLMMGVDVPTVAELTGTSPEMIYRTYGHLLDKHLQEAAEKLMAGRKAR